jgi:hypothetical protein
VALGTADLIRTVREVVQDLGMEFDFDGDRHSDTKLLRYTNMAFQDAFRVRPDIFNICGYPTDIPSVDADDLTANNPIPVDPMYFSAIVDYISGLIGLGDDEFSLDGRAVTLLNRFTQKLQGKGA